MNELKLYRYDGKDLAPYDTVEVIERDARGARSIVDYPVDAVRIVGMNWQPAQMLLRITYVIGYTDAQGEYHNLPQPRVRTVEVTGHQVWWDEKLHDIWQSGDVYKLLLDLTYRYGLLERALPGAAVEIHDKDGRVVEEARAVKQRGE